MSNQAVGNVYQAIIEEVVNSSRVDFEESGVEESVLEELRLVRRALACPSVHCPLPPIVSPVARPSLLRLASPRLPAVRGLLRRGCCAYAGDWRRARGCAPVFIWAGF